MRLTNAQGMGLPKTANSLFIVGIICLNLIGCGEIKKESPQERSSEPVVPVVSAPKKEEGIKSEQVKFLLQETNIPHQYQLAISWPEDNQKIVIEESGSKVFETASVHEYLYPIKDGTKYSVRVFSYDKENPILLGEMKGAAPKDYSMDAPMELKQDLVVEAHRVFLNNKVSLQTNGFIVKFKADKFISDEAEIFSFPSGQKAPLRTSGRGGGLVEIRAKEARGHLKIRLIGEHGGDGIDGEPYTHRASDGLPGANGDHTCLRAPVTGNIIKCVCTSQPDPGTPGERGAPGRPGLAAGAGGNSGIIRVEISEKSEFGVEPFQDIGLAGRTGKGGPGQAGGVGGPPGDPTSLECHTSTKGSDGGAGDPGEDAAPAANGLRDLQCISIGQGEGKCAS